MGYPLLGPPQQLITPLQIIENNYAWPKEESRAEHMHTRRKEEKASMEERRGKRKERIKTGSTETRRVTKNSDGGKEEEGKGERLALPLLALPTLFPSTALLQKPCIVKQKINSHGVPLTMLSTATKKPPPNNRK